MQVGSQNLARVDGQAADHLVFIMDSAMRVEKPCEELAQRETRLTVRVMYDAQAVLAEREERQVDDAEPDGGFGHSVADMLPRPQRRAVALKTPHGNSLERRRGWLRRGLRLTQSHGRWRHNRSFRKQARDRSPELRRLHTVVK